MILLNVVNASKGFGDRELFTSISFDVNENERIGLVGANGCGKSTLFKLIMKECEPDAGSFIFSKNCNVGYMQQHAGIDFQATIYEEMLTAFKDLIEIEKRLEEVTNEIEHSNGTVERFIHEQAALQEQFERQGGLTYKSRAKAALLGLGFAESEFDKPCSILSGGQKSKLSLGKLLLSPTNLLLLDEPTNHLDINAVEWLEGFLNSYAGSVIVISHDRYFLDKVTNKTLEIEHGKLTTYHGNYSHYLEKKQENKEIIEHHYATSMREIKRVEGIIAQQRQWNREKNIRTAENKEKMLERLKADLVKPDSELDSLSFTFTARTQSGDDVLKCIELQKSFGQQKLFSNASFQIKNTERIFLLGANGCGKTTLLKIITNRLSADCGRVIRGANVEIGYFDQIQAGLNPESTVIDEIWNRYPDMTQTQVRNALASFLFKGDEVFAQIKALSGGERARVALLKLMLAGPNFLLLDEPTNHLDISSREALENALLSYGGTMLIVSHDRYFINKLATRILYMDENGITDYHGNYDYFSEKSALNVQALTPTAPAAVKEKPTNDYKARKEKQAEQRRTAGKITRLEKEIADTEAAIAESEAKMADPDFAAQYELLVAETDTHNQLNEKLSALYEQWEELQLALEEMQE